MAEVEKAVLEKVGHVISSINASKHVDQVISAVYSLAALLFPVDCHSFIGEPLLISITDKLVTFFKRKKELNFCLVLNFAGSIGEKYKDEVKLNFCLLLTETNNNNKESSHC